MTKRRRRSRHAAARGGGLPRPSPLADRPRSRRPGGFTLVELLVVMVIISILLGFILNAAMNSVDRAREQATRGLITKLEQGLNDRLEALLQTRPDPNTAHIVMAAINSNGANPLPGYHRAQVIAWYDYIRRYMPDTFFVQDNLSSFPTPLDKTVGIYPFNFAANPYPIGGTATDPAGLGLYILPMGNSVQAPYGDATGLASKFSQTNNTGLMEYNPTGDGIHGAAYSVAAGLYKQLGYLPQGYDGIDNNADGTVDDAVEGIGNNPNVPSPDNASLQISLSSMIQGRLGNHKHITARAEVLYALLVEGQGPLGSVFSRDEFTDKEVQDTDGDGMLEFVDGWGNPLQFFRWPLLYHSDIQRGQVLTPSGAGSWTIEPPYSTMYEQREQDPLDLNQQLVAPAWWSATYNSSSYLSGYPTHDTGTGLQVSGPAGAFEYYFHRLTEPHSSAGGTTYWDRGGTYGGRRAYYTKFLVLSGGLDGQPGVFLYDDSRMAIASASPNSLGGARAFALIANENNAMPFSATDTSSGGFTVNFTNAAQYGQTAITYTQTVDPTAPSTGDLIQYAQDDITNQNIQFSVGIGGGG